MAESDANRIDAFFGPDPTCESVLDKSLFFLSGTGIGERSLLIR